MRPERRLVTSVILAATVLTHPSTGAATQPTPRACKSVQPPPGWVKPLLGSEVWRTLSRWSPRFGDVCAEDEAGRSGKVRFVTLAVKVPAALSRRGIAYEASLPLDLSNDFFFNEISVRGWLTDLPDRIRTFERDPVVAVILRATAAKTARVDLTQIVAGAANSHAVAWSLVLNRRAELFLDSRDLVDELWGALPELSDEPRIDELHRKTGIGVARIGATRIGGRVYADIGNTIWVSEAEGGCRECGARLHFRVHDDRMQLDGFSVHQRMTWTTLPQVARAQAIVVALFAHGPLAGCALEKVPFGSVTGSWEEKQPTWQVDVSVQCPRNRVVVQTRLHADGTHEDPTIGWRDSDEAPDGPLASHTVVPLDIATLSRNPHELEGTQSYRVGSIDMDRRLKFSGNRTQVLVRATPAGGLFVEERTDDEGGANREARLAEDLPEESNPRWAIRTLNWPLSPQWQPGASPKTRPSISLGWLRAVAPRLPRTPNVRIELAALSLEHEQVQGANLDVIGPTMLTTPSASVPCTLFRLSWRRGGVFGGERWWMDGAGRLLRISTTDGLVLDRVE